MRRQACRAGDATWIPAEAAHSLENSSQEDWSSWWSPLRIGEMKSTKFDSIDEKEARIISMLTLNNY